MWGSVLRCEGRCRKVCGRGDGVWELKCWGRCGKMLGCEKVLGEEWTGC